jgi:hypothetical protein
VGNTCHECFPPHSSRYSCTDLAREHEAREERRLKPCPFCGTEWDEDEEDSPLAVAWLTRGNRMRYQVACEECGARGPEGDLEYEARALWNEIPRTN